MTGVLEWTGPPQAIVFTTVNIAQYRGLWHGGTADFAELLQLLLDRTERIAFRMSSLYPQIVDERLCRVVADPRVRPHFHLSVQSGSDSVLSAMNRPYTAGQVLEAVDRLRQVKENPFLACDIIAGFPGETDTDFEQTMRLCRTCGFGWIHAFPFSPRPGTPAYTMKPSVPQSVAGTRVNRLEELAFSNKIAYIDSFTGRILDAVTEVVRSPRHLPERGARMHAVTDNFIHCELPVPEAVRIPAGSSVRVRLTGTLAEKIRAGAEWEATAELVR